MGRFVGFWRGCALAAAACVSAVQTAESCAAAPQAPGPAARFADPLTGREVVRISHEPGSISLYFNYNSFTPQGDMMVIRSPSGIVKVRLKDWSTSPLVLDKDAKLLFVGRRTRTAYYSHAENDGGSTVFAADIDSGRVRRIARLARGGIAAINADETLLAGAVAERDVPLQPGGDGGKPGETAFAATGPDGKPLTYAEAKELRLNQRLEARIPMRIFTIDVRTGAQRTVVASTDWLNHVQFSPTDPTLLMYCHEGPWHKVDRIWTVRADGSERRPVHRRTMNMEIAGHEFFSPDGKWIWYDLQTPRGEVFWLAGYEVATGKRRWFHVERNQWSVHYNQSADAAVFSGDGGDAQMVARAQDAKYLYLFKPRNIPDVAGIHADDADTLVSPGVLDAEKIVDLRRHDYRLEPNAVFTPDGNWIIFRSNMEGATHVYAVSLRSPVGEAAKSG